MGKYLISVSYLAMLVFNASLFANGEKARPILAAMNNLSGEMVSTEKSFHQQLLKLLSRMQEDNAKLETKKSELKKYPWNLIQIIETENFLKDIVNVDTNLKAILMNGQQLLFYLNSLNDAIKVFDSKKVFAALKDVDNFFLKDQLFLQPFKNYVGKFADFQNKYSKLYNQYSLGGSFYNDIAQYLSVPIQRGPRYQLLFGGFKEKLSELLALDPTNSSLDLLFKYVTKIYENIRQKSMTISGEKIK